MERPTWLVDPNRIATKIRSASGALDHREINWKSNPTKSCPNCQHVIDNSDVIQVWPGLPRGVKFDPSDQEIIWHLLSKASAEDLKPHPFIDEFIPTVEEEDGICYTHPQNLPGVKQDGSVSHFFHRAVKAYGTGTRKRRKIHGGDDCGDVRWHKTGRTKPVHLDGVQRGCKKIMVLYVSSVKGGKAEKTNWVMHQYHLGTGEDEREGEYVISKIFYQQQHKLAEKSEAGDNSENIEVMITKADPITPKLVTPEPPRADRRIVDLEPELELALHTVQHQDEALVVVAELNPPFDQSNDDNQMDLENHGDQMEHKNEDGSAEDNKWWENESQFLLSSQQLVEGLSLCDELLRSQSPNRDDNDNDNHNHNGNAQMKNSKILQSYYTHLGPEDLKRDLEECQKLDFDPPNIELDTPPDFRLSQLEFESEDSYIAWGGSIRK